MLHVAAHLKIDPMSAADSAQTDRFLERMRRSSASPAIVTFIYLAVGLVWILVSDLVVGERFAAVPFIQTIKGASFITLTGLVLFVVLSRRERALSAAVRALHESEELHRAVVEAAGEGIALVSSTGNATFVNPRLREILGLGDLRAVSLFDRLGPSTRKEAEAGLASVLAKGERSEVVVSFELPDGRSIDAELCMAPLRGPGGAIDGAVVMLDDITAWVGAERDRDRARGQLEESARFAALGRLASAVAHEFNNVLMGVLPYVEVIRRSAGTDPKIEKSAVAISTSVDRGRRITQDILGFTRLASPSLRSVDLREWLGGMAAEIATVLGDAVTLEMRIGEEPLTMAADQQQLKQVVLALVQNARDAMPEGGALSIRAGRGSSAEASFGGPEKFAHIRLLDRGAGIPADVLPQLFEPLFALKGRGIRGMALPIAHQIVVNHQGYLLASNDPAGGTAFDLFVPLAVA